MRVNSLEKKIIILDVLAGIAIFLAGFLSSVLFSVYFYGGDSFADYISNGVLNNNGGFSNTANDYVKSSDILVYPDRVVIKVEGASIGRYAPTGSMIPVLDSGTNGIRIVPGSENDINVGDIVTFRDNGRLIIHRVIEKGHDDLGVYFITKGDNNLVDDGKIRFEDIVYKTIGLIY